MGKKHHFISFLDVDDLRIFVQHLGSTLDYRREYLQVVHNSCLRVAAGKTHVIDMFVYLPAGHVSSSTSTGEYEKGHRGLIINECKLKTGPPGGGGEMATLNYATKQL